MGKLKQLMIENNIPTSGSSEWLRDEWTDERVYIALHRIYEKNNLEGTKEAETPNPQHSSP